MKNTFFSACLALVAVLGILSVSSASPSTSATIIMPADLAWTPVTGMTGAQQALLEGDPAKTGAYVVRYKFAAGFKLPFHWQPTEERFTVLSGTPQFLTQGASGTKMTTLSPGSFVIIPAGVRHTMNTKTEAVVQFSGIGPLKMNFVK